MSALVPGNSVGVHHIWSPLSAQHGTSLSVRVPVACKEVISNALLGSSVRVAIACKENLGRANFNEDQPCGAAWIAAKQVSSLITTKHSPPPQLRYPNSTTPCRIRDKAALTIQPGLIRCHATHGHASTPHLPLVEVMLPQQMEAPRPVVPSRARPEDAESMPSFFPPALQMQASRATLETMPEELVQRPLTVQQSPQRERPHVQRSSRAIAAPVTLPAAGLTARASLPLQQEQQQHQQQQQQQQQPQPQLLQSSRVQKPASATAPAGGSGLSTVQSGLLHGRPAMTMCVTGMEKNLSYMAPVAIKGHANQASYIPHMPLKTELMTASTRSLSPATRRATLPARTQDTGIAHTGRCALTLEELWFDGVRFDPMLPSAQAQLLSQMGLPPTASIEPMQQQGGLNAGLWLLSCSTTPATLVLKLVNSQREHPELPTEAERYIRLAREYPVLAQDTALAFPVRIFRCCSREEGGSRHDLVVMPKASGQCLDEVVSQKWRCGQTASLMRVFEALGSFLAAVHTRHGMQHHDFTISNIFYNEANGVFTMIDLADFGPQHLSEETDVDRFTKGIELVSKWLNSEIYVDGMRHFQAGYSAGLAGRTGRKSWPS